MKYSDLKKKIFEERGPYCQKCGKNEIGTFLDLHHLKFKSSGGKNTEDNLVILCRKCHNESHGITTQIGRERHK